MSRRQHQETLSCKHQHGGSLPTLRHQPPIYDLYYGHQPQHSGGNRWGDPIHWSPAQICATASPHDEATDDLHTSSGHPFMEPTLEQAVPGWCHLLQWSSYHPQPHHLRQQTTSTHPVDIPSWSQHCSKQLQLRWCHQLWWSSCHPPPHRGNRWDVSNEDISIFSHLHHLHLLHASRLGNRKYISPTRP